MNSKRLLGLGILFSAAFGTAAMAEDYVLTLKDHQFTPATLTVPAGQVIKIVVKNEQTVPAEFESAQLDREKAVKPGSEITLKLGPLDAGDYTYVDDFHRDTTGVITAK